MKDLKGKKILILGGTAPCVHVTQFAKSMGAYVYVADASDELGPAKKLADKPVVISTADHESLLKFVKENHIDGILTGPGEFNIQNAMAVSKMAGLPFYCNKEQWNICQDKRNFKDFCKKNGLPAVPEYSIEDELTEKDFPVIVKPVDGCSSRGISVCRNNKEYSIAKIEAINASKSGKILVEKYIDNGGVTIDAKYLSYNDLNGGGTTAYSKRSETVMFLMVA